MNTIQLSTSIRTVVAGLHKGLRRQASTDAFSMTEIETIGHLIRQTSLLPTELAALTRVKTQSMSQILKKIEEHGLIKRTPSKEDKRKVFISLTAAGKKLVEQFRQEKDEWLKNAIEQSLTDRERELLIKALPVLSKLADNK